jgi:HEAT repeat protein
MPNVRLSCPACGYHAVINRPLFAPRPVQVTCPHCGRRFPFGRGLQVRRPAAPPWQRWLGWLLLPLGYLLLLMVLALLTALLVVIVPAGAVAKVFFPDQLKGSGSAGEVVVTTLWAPLSLAIFALPLLAGYRLVSFQWDLPWLPPLSLLLGLSPGLLARVHLGLAAITILTLLFYLLRLVPGKLAQLRELQLLVPSKARSAVMGLVELQGVLRIVPPDAPGSKVRWYLEDDSGRIPLAPELPGGMPLPLCNNSLYHLDEGLADGDYVYLLGHVLPNPDGTGLLDSERLVVRPVREGGLPVPVRGGLRDQRPLKENPGIFILAAGGEGWAQRLLRRQLIGHAALSLATIAAAVWLINAELPRLHGYAGWSAAEVAAAPEPVLRQLILTADRERQRQAAAPFFARWRDLGEKDPQRPDWVAPTLTLLRHPDPATRALALRAVGTLQSAADQVSPELHALLGDSQAELRTVAATALGRLGVQPEASVAALLPLLQNDPAPEVSAAACRALAAFDQADAWTAQCLTQALPGATGAERPQTAQALARVTGDPARVVPVLAGLLSDPDPLVRLAAAEGLRAHGPAAAPAVAQIVAVLPAEPDGAVMYRLLQAAREIGPAAEPLVPYLLEEFRTLKPPHTRRDTILSVLRGIGPGARGALPELLALLADPAIPEDELRAAMAILGEFGAQAQSAIPAAQRLAEGAREGETRRVAEWLLKRLAPVRP